jgi:hypothetical protein
MMDRAATYPLLFLKENDSMSPELGSHISMLTNALNLAAQDSSRVANRIVWLTVGLVFVGLLQALATAWPWLSWWWEHR